MKLNALAGAVPGKVEIFGDGQTEISALCSDTRRAAPGALFFCIPGMHVDAHDLAPQALKSGAVALVVERRLPLDCPQVKVRSVREALSYMAQAFFGNPARRMRLIGVTGTKGKTTSSFLIKSILEAAGYKTGLIGTVCSMIGEEVIPSRLTTPDPIEVQTLLKSMADAGVEYVVMEVSAHALAMHRLSGMRFAVAAFTNFSQDHLDYFGDMDNYFAAKMRLLQADMSDAVVYNCDDERVCEGVAALGREALRTGIRESSDVYANDIEVGERGLTFLLTSHKRFRVMVKLRLSGIFNVYNALLAAGVAIVLGVGPEAIRTGLEDVRAVPGRIELLETETPYRVILDYAHSPDSLENILKSVRQTTRGRLIALFGCGGDRDRGKRPIMGEIAGELADLVILTSDNPRNEDPFEILNQIEEGIRHTGCEYTVIENRREAIRHALSIAGSSDVIVLAGKGHETYQEIRGVKHPFDEKIVVRELLEEMRGREK
ncbi:MAG TPA: UDP-N-acetylmuramoyl-L-alanyl-D-glutamate--2,6-diaminopimelate ligase [Candidatus Pullichristensenella avicola]|nr:UDP-N-acetylmuramoyl-L-alanyl-D-glutamate--2,6-diaminopimelate ligase [Candidatus Pullichristensenella avicola]